jgi:glycosyltransferase involved in cell wall biosynthesis
MTTRLHIAQSAGDPRSDGDGMDRGDLSEVKSPRVTLVVCTVGRTSTLTRLFESLAGQQYRDFDVVLVDQNPPGTLETTVDAYSGRIQIHHLRSERGLSRARNVGLAAAAGALVGFPDDDCWYDPTTLTDVVRRFADPSIDIATGRTTDASGRTSVSPTLDAESAINRRNFLLCGNSNAIFARRAAFEVIGPFDVRLGVGASTIFQSGEEADILLRATDAGLTARFFPDLVTHHDQVDAVITSAQIDRAERYGAGFGALLRKNRFSVGYVSARLIRTLTRAALAFAQGDPALAP